MELNNKIKYARFIHNTKFPEFIGKIGIYETVHQYGNNFPSIFYFDGTLCVMTYSKPTPKLGIYISNDVPNSNIYWEIEFVETSEVPLSMTFLKRARSLVF